jgi:diphosphomevalonate decarboxylase
MCNQAVTVTRLLANRAESIQREADVFAPANIALCKYWGKRDTELNLPVTDSLSLSLGALGSRCKMTIADGAADHVQLNGTLLPPENPFACRLSRFLDLFRGDQRHHFRIETVNTIPTAAGFASSASGFAAIVKALDTLHGWRLPERSLSILARLGSGSASRSLWQGFVHWHAGGDADGMDCFAEPMPEQWPDLRIGLLILNRSQKATGSTEAMRRTVETSVLYEAWPRQVATDLAAIRQAIRDCDIAGLGTAVEANALAMHATMMAARPAVLYWQPESVAAMQRVWSARAEGLPVYFTMDAGPNVKLLFRETDRTAIEQRFKELVTANPWQTPDRELTSL